MKARLFSDRLIHRKFLVGGVFPNTYPQSTITCHINSESVKKHHHSCW
ncbi:MAG: hypothetical protein ACHBN1_03970 [Heteroscytonema crispum UTEX LB 1556]